MRMANRLLSAAIPAAALNLSDDGVTPAQLDEIQAHSISDFSFNVESVAYFQLMMRLRERRADRVRFLERLVFTPGVGDWRAVHLPEPLFPLYRLVRLSRLAAKLLRT